MSVFDQGPSTPRALRDDAPERFSTRWRLDSRPRQFSRPCPEENGWLRCWPVLLGGSPISRGIRDHVQKGGRQLPGVEPTSIPHSGGSM